VKNGKIEKENIVVISMGNLLKFKAVDNNVYKYIKRSIIMVLKFKAVDNNGIKI
jgi:hypothetical protein